jgi:DNA polymerase III sliding clamp (beta) subunit (PCNA family)
VKHNQAVESEIASTISGKDDAFIIDGSEILQITVYSLNEPEIRLWAKNHYEDKIVLSLDELKDCLKSFSFFAKKKKTRFVATLIRKEDGK